jgi:hypothetical protein
MPGRWSDERERGGERPRGEGGRWQGREDRSFGPGERVFGERESGAAYNRPLRDAPVDYTASYRGRDADDRPDWQNRDYGGVSPGFREQERDYESGYRAHPRAQATQDYRSGGRFYGDDGRGRIYREDYGSGPAHVEGRRFGTREADDRYDRAIHRPGSGPTFSGGTGGYDYERGYGDGGRGDGGRDFEDRARDAGEFFRRTGRRVANWFSDVAGEGSEMGRDEDRGARGLGPKGYKRSDERISDEVHQRLTDDPWLDASDIGVAVSGGEVTLTGSVANREAKHRAERLVEDLSGVTHVQNNLRPRPAGAYGATAAHLRTEGDGATETSANATGTTTRRN